MEPGIEKVTAVVLTAVLAGVVFFFRRTPLLVVDSQVSGNLLRPFVSGSSRRFDGIVI